VGLSRGAQDCRAIGICKTQVNGESIYALRVAGLSTADAMALRVRVKGRDGLVAATGRLSGRGKFAHDNLICAPPIPS
jgi:hypothetical protein